MGKKVIVGDFIRKFLTFLHFNYDKFTIFTFLKYVLMFSYMHIITLGLWGHLFHYVNTLNGKPFQYTMIGPDVAGILSSYFAIYFEIMYLINIKHFRYILDELGNFENYDMPKGFDKQIKKINNVAKVAVLIFYFSQFFVWFLTLLQKCERGDESDCGLTITAYMPFDIFYTPMRQIFSFLQCTSGFHSGSFTLAIALIFLFMFQSLVLNVKHLQVLLLEIPKMASRRERRMRIKKCVLYHYRILYLVEQCARLSEKFLLMLVFLASVVISLTSYQLVAVKVEYLTVVHLGGYLFSSMSICIQGERLIAESEKLFFTLYDAIPWGGDVATAQDLYLMMLMAKDNLYLPAGKFGPVGHVRAMLVLKSSYSFLTLILNI